MTRRESSSIPRDTETFMCVEIRETSTQWVVVQVFNEDRRWMATYDSPEELIEFLRGYYGV